MIIGLMVSVFIGRTIGADGLGIINLANRIVNILIIIGLLGIQQVIIKEVAIARDKRDFIHIGNVMYTAYWINGGFTLVISVILILLTPLMANHVFNEPRLTYPLMIALVAMTPQVFSRVFSAGLVGYRKIWQSNLVEQTLSIVVTGITLIIFWLIKGNITVNLVATCYAIGRVVVTFSVGMYWRSLYHHRAKRQFIAKKLMKISLPLLMVTATGIIMANFDVIILGGFTSSDEVGLYAVAARIALLTSFFLQISNAAISPKFAALFQSGKIDEMEKMAQQVTKGLGFIGFVPFIISVIAGKYILSIWGGEFTEAYFILIILSFGQFINIGTGSVGTLLAMTGHEKILFSISLTFLLISIGLSFLLTHYYKSLGLAIAVSFTIIAINIVRMLMVKKYLGINIVTFKMNLRKIH